MSRLSERHAAAIVLVLAALVGAWILLLGETDSQIPPANPASPAAKPATEPRIRKRRKSGGAEGAPSTPESPRPDRAPDASGTLVVRVRSGGEPVEGARIVVTDGSCDEREATTGASGEVTFESMPAGPTEIRVDATDRLQGVRKLVLAAKARESVEVTLESGAVVEGTVLDATRGAGIAGADVVLLGRDGATLSETTTDATGRFRLAGTPGARVTVRTSHAGFRPTAVSADLAAAGGGATRVEARVVAAGGLRGVVRDADGVAAADAWVGATTESRSGSVRDAGSTLSGADGSYVIDTAPLGAPITVSASLAGWADAAPATGIVLREEAREATRDLVLRRHASLVVHVLDASDRPVAAEIALDGKRTTSHRAVAEGLLLERLAPGAHVVRVEPSSATTGAEADVTLAEGRRAEVQIRVEPAVSITGRVVDETGAPVRGAVVAVAENAAAVGGASVRWSTRGSVTLDDEGRFRIDGLRRGPHDLAVLGTLGTNRGAMADASDQDVPRFTVEAPATEAVLRLPRVAAIVFRVVAPESARSRPRVIVVESCASDASPNSAAATDRAVTFDRAAWLAESRVRCSVAQGTTALRIRITGYAPVIVPIRPSIESEFDAGDVRLSAGITLTGHVVDSDGRPVAGAVVPFGPLSGIIASRGTRDDGAFTVEHLAPGKVVLRADAEGRAGSALVDVAPDAPPVAIVARRLGTLRGTVVGADGAVAKRVRVTVRHGAAEGADDEGRVASALTDERGAFEIPVAAGRVRASVGGDWAEDTVPEGGEATVRVVAR